MNIRKCINNIRFVLNYKQPRYFTKSTDKYEVITNQEYLSTLYPDIVHCHYSNDVLTNINLAYHYMSCGPLLKSEMSEALICAERNDTNNEWSDLLKKLRDDIDKYKQGHPVKIVAYRSLNHQSKE